MTVKQDIAEACERLTDFVVKSFKAGVGRNLLFLYGLQVSDYILPLVVVPYLVRVLGPSGFGVVSFVQSLMDYLSLLVNYGFNWSATRAISIKRDDWEAVSRTASQVWTAKALLCLAGSLFLVTMTILTPRLQAVSSVVFVLYGIVVGNMLFPVWLFQGLEQMEGISISRVTARVLATCAIFLFVKQTSDYPIYALILSLQWIVGSIMAVLIAFHRFELHFQIPKWDEVRVILVEGWTLFLSSAATSLYTAGNAFILGLLTNNIVVGYFSAAEKLIRAARRMLGPISQVLYPRLSKLASESRSVALTWGRRSLLLVGGLGAVLSLFLLIGAELIVEILLGESYGPSIVVTRILAPIPFFVGISSVLGAQIMLPFGYDRMFTIILVFAGLVNVVSGSVLSFLFQEVGMAISVMMAEGLVVMAMILFLGNRGFNLLSSSAS